MTPKRADTPKFRIDVDVFSEIQRLAASEKPRFSPAQIHRWITGIEEYRGRVPSLRTVQRAAKVLEQRPDEEKRPDEPFQWHHMGDHCLPWEAGPYLLRMWAFAEDGGIAPHIARSENVLLGASTFRDAKWWWRVHLAVPDISLFDVHWLARIMTYLERTNVPVPTDDFQVFLAYRPWMNHTVRKRYKQYISDNCIRPDMPASEVLTRDLTPGEDRFVAILSEHNRFIRAQLHLGLAAEYGILWSQMFHLFVKLGCYELRVDVSDPDLFGALSGNHPTTPQVPEVELASEP